MSFNFFVLLTVCWMMIFHEQLCTSMAQHNCTGCQVYYSQGVGTYIFHKSLATWNEARRICSEGGGHLAVINSANEAHTLKSILEESGVVEGAYHPNNAYIGIHDMYTEGEWLTIFGDTLAKAGFADWSDQWGGQPDNGGGHSNCGTLLTEGKLNDVPCFISLPFICEQTPPRSLTDV